MYTYTQYLRLDPPVWESNRFVIRLCWKKMQKKIKRDPEFRAARKQFYREMLSFHHTDQLVCKALRI